MFRRLKCFIDIEDKSASVASESQIQTDVHAFFEFPAVAHTEIGQSLRPAECVEIVKYVARTHPQGDPVASPYFLAEFHLRLDQVAVAVTPVVIPPMRYEPPKVASIVHGTRP